VHLPGLINPDRAKQKARNRLNVEAKYLTALFPWLGNTHTHHQCSDKTETEISIHEAPMIRKISRGKLWFALLDALKPERHP